MLSGGSPIAVWPEQHPSAVGELNNDVFFIRGDVAYRLEIAVELFKAAHVSFAFYCIFVCPYGRIRSF